jgi:hypothetical protein
VFYVLIRAPLALSPGSKDPAHTAHQTACTTNTTAVVLEGARPGHALPNPSYSCPSAATGTVGKVTGNSVSSVGRAEEGALLSTVLLVTRRVPCLASCDAAQQQHGLAGS